MMINGVTTARPYLSHVYVLHTLDQRVVDLIYSEALLRRGYLLPHKSYCLDFGLLTVDAV